MEVSVESTGILGRRMTVEIAATQIEDQIADRLKSLAKKIRMDGFRPGKVPVKVVKTRYGEQVRQEVLDEVLRQSLQDAITQKSLKLAGGPKIENINADPGQPLRFTAEFEVFPEIQLAPLGEVKIERPTAEIEEQDIERMIETFRKQRVEWISVERAAQIDDQLTVDFEGSIDGEVFEGGEGTDVEIVLGSNRMIEGFESQLVGARSGEHRTIEVQFPDDYPGKVVAGKSAQFSVQVKVVAEASLPTVDEEFIRSFGVKEGGLDALHKELRQNMQRELETAIRRKVKERVMDALLQINTVELPNTLVEEQIDRMVAQASSQGRAKLDAKDPSVRNRFQESARKSVGLGLISSELIQQHNLTATPEKVRETIATIATSYEDPEQVVQWYYNNKEAMSNIEASVIEEEVVDCVLEQAEIVHIPTTFAQIMDQHSST
jgi:trigger factor